MKRPIMLLFVGAIMFASCGTEKTNPLLTKWDTPFETPPFDKIKTEHYLPAFEKAIIVHNEEIDKIVKNSEEATFTNTIEALDYSGELLKE